MIPLDKIGKIVTKYETLEKELASGDISKKDFVKKSKEYANIGEIVDTVRSYLNFEKEKPEGSILFSSFNIFFICYNLSYRSFFNREGIFK